MHAHVLLDGPDHATACFHSATKLYVPQNPECLNHTFEFSAAYNMHFLPRSWCETRNFMALPMCQRTIFAHLHNHATRLSS